MATLADSVNRATRFPAPFGSATTLPTATVDAWVDRRIRPTDRTIDGGSIAAAWRVPAPGSAWAPIRAITATQADRELSTRPSTNPIITAANRPSFSS